MGKKYRVEGKGKRTIVFVHYFGGDARSWQWVVKRLKKKYTCVLLNLPGFGGTPPLAEPSIYEFASYINTCISELQLKDYILCGHSMGAKLALYAAKLAKEAKPTKIVLIAPSPPTVEHMSDEEKERMLKHPNRAEAINTVNGATVKPLSKPKFDHAVSSQLIIDPATWRWWLNQGMDHSIANRIKDLDMEVTVIYSKKDPVIPESAIFTEVLPYIKNPSTITLGKVGHLIPMEAPKKLSRQLHRILKRDIAKENKADMV